MDDQGIFLLFLNSHKLVCLFTIYLTKWKIRNRRHSIKLFMDTLMVLLTLPEQYKYIISQVKYPFLNIQRTEEFLKIFY